MKPYYQDDWLTVYHGDCKAVMAEMEPESVHCVVTSPPYWGLRDYGTATWVGGDTACDHVRPNARMAHERRASTLGGGVATVAAQDAGVNAESVCGRCGATRIDAQLGLEPTPEAYVANIVAVFREVRRVLRADGTVWLNLGDSYAGSNQTGGNGSETITGGKRNQQESMHAFVRPLAGLKPKDLVGIPWRTAFALQADGWYLRSEIIWHKPNPMPESVTDRPTRSHEYLFLLSKSARYYYDNDAIREPHTDPERGRRASGESSTPHAWKNLDKGTTWVPGVRQYNPAGRNVRSVWTIATAPYPGAHFATFPPKLVEPCIKAGTSERGVCPECGAPWVRVVKRQGGERYATGKSAAKNGAGLATAFSGYTDGSSAPTFTTTGWRPTCTHISPLPPRQAIVLDPFAGSGTTGMVAQSLSRRAVLIDLSLDYLGQLMDRNADIPLGLGS